MSDHEGASSSTAQPAAASRAVPYNFPLPAPVKLFGGCLSKLQALQDAVRGL